MSLLLALLPFKISTTVSIYYGEHNACSDIASGATS